jgi:hypothetical protein
LPNYLAAAKFAAFPDEGKLVWLLRFVLGLFEAVDVATKVKV